MKTCTFIQGKYHYHHKLVYLMWGGGVRPTLTLGLLKIIRLFEISPSLRSNSSLLLIMLGVSTANQSQDCRQVPVWFLPSIMIV